MTINQSWVAVVLVTAGAVTVLAASFSGGWPSDSSTWICVVGALLAQSSILFLLRRDSQKESQTQAPDSLQQRQLEFDEWQLARAEELQQLSERLQKKQRAFMQRLTRFQEFVEYPVDESTDEASSADRDVRLSEQDRQVHELLEKEAERVYEKLRKNEFTVDGVVDFEQIRTDIFRLVRQVAHVYSPKSNNPLLETSFEQLARAASRICLHSLVLLEQLPGDVKAYNLNEMHGYIRKAVQGYGTYQHVAPWIKHLSRTAYAGRFAAGANPLTLGAWWLATEVSRRGAKKLVENLVDRQAVAVLHDIVTVIGAEVANIYGPGFRQRDPAWVYGTELTELLKHFPMSRESLSRGLQEITALPLRSEYDRIYLYRCLAERRSAGSRISDPALLVRTERELIAGKLESFFDTYLHGINDSDRQKWQNEVESRLDLKLSVGQTQQETHLEKQAEAAATSIYQFLTTVADTPAAKAGVLVGSCALMTHLPLTSRPALIDALVASSAARFEPPDLDPTSEIAGVFLRCLFECCVEAGSCDGHIESLLIETAGYFRRSREEAQGILDEIFQLRLQRLTAAGASGCRLDQALTRVILRNMHAAECMTAAYSGVAIVSNGQADELRDGVLVLLKDTSHGTERALLVNSDGTTYWNSSESVVVKRHKGYLIDDCEIHGGEWLADGKADFILISGSITGGGFQKMFGTLQTAFSVADSSSD